MLIALWTLYPMLYLSGLQIIRLYQKDIHSNDIKFSVSQGEENVSPKKSTQPFWGVFAPLANGRLSLPFMLYQERWDWPFRHIAHIPTLPRQTIQGRCVGEMLMEEREWQFHHIYYAWICRKRKCQHKSLCATPLQNPGIVTFCICQTDILYNNNRYFIIFYKHFLLYQLTSNYWQ